MSESFMESVRSWNEKIYRNKDGTHADGGLRAQDLWDEFGIKSGPKFKDACWSQIPEKWADDVRALIRAAQNELGDKVTFAQLKEKFARLTVYYDYDSDDTKQRMDQLIKECIERLVKQGVHPPVQGVEND